MNNFLLDTNIIIDSFSAGILKCLNCNLFYISQVVFKEEVIKQIPSLSSSNFNIINENLEELLTAEKYQILNKKISFYDALNLVIAKKRNMILVTGDQELIKYARQKEVECIGTIKIIEILLDNSLIDINESILALRKLKQDSKRRIPHYLIDLTIEKIQSRVLVK